MIINQIAQLLMYPLYAIVYLFPRVNDLEQYLLDTPAAIHQLFAVLPTIGYFFPVLGFMSAISFIIAGELALFAYKMISGTVRMVSMNLIRIN